MPKLKYFISCALGGLLIIALATVSGCACNCTLRACPAFLEARVANEDGSPLTLGTYQIDWTMGDTSGSVVFPDDENDPNVISPFMDDNRIVFTLLSESELDEISADEIEITVSADQQIVFNGSFKITTTKKVCNECTGAPYCEDETYDAFDPIEVQLPQQ